MVTGRGIRKMRNLASMALGAALGGCASMIVPIGQAQAKEFGGYDRSDDCAGHAAGYRWAEANSVTDEATCPLRGGAVSFYEGCLVYVEDPSRGADEDDEGNDVN